MLVYRAKEKDCVGTGGEPQECVICFEEFEEGDEMGRLECLCKFHRVSCCYSTLLLLLLFGVMIDVSRSLSSFVMSACLRRGPNVTDVCAISARLA